MPVERVNQSSGVAFLVSSGIVYEIIAANCSSPQTAELNAATRGPTVMKWVNVGVAQAAGFVLIAAYIDRAHSTAILTGGGLAAAIMYASYLHGRSAGLKSSAPPTETWGQAQQAA
jgi:hypothetical protein